MDLSIKPVCALHTGQAVPLGMLSCHHDDTGQCSSLEKCHDSLLAVTLFISLGSCLSQAWFVITVLEIVRKKRSGRQMGFHF